jgi:hypothetical protein
MLAEFSNNFSFPFDAIEKETNTYGSLDIDFLSFESSAAPSTAAKGPQLGWRSLSLLVEMIRTLTAFDMFNSNSLSFVLTFRNGRYINTMERSADPLQLRLQFFRRLGVSRRI